MAPPVGDLVDATPHDLVLFEPCHRLTGVFVFVFVLGGVEALLEARRDRVSE